MSSNPIKKILYVRYEDFDWNPISLLNKSEFSMEVVTSHQECIAKLESIKFSVILMEIGKDNEGFESAEAILSNRHIPIIFLGSSEDSGLFDQAVKISPYGFIPLGLSANYLKAAIYTALNYESVLLTQKEHDQRLRLMELVVEHAKDAIVITEAEPYQEPGPRILFVNDAFTKMTGYQPEEVIGHSPRLLQGPKTDKRELAKLSKALTNLEPCELTVVNYRKNGVPFWCNISISPVVDEHGTCTHWIAVQRDVTQKKENELRIYESEKRYRGLMSNINAGVVLHAADTSILLANERASAILGLSLDQMQGKKAIDPDWNFLSSDHEQLPLELYPVNQILHSQQPIYDQVLGIVKSLEAEPTWVLVNGIPIFNEDGSLKEVIVNFVDITELRRAEMALSKSLKEKNILLKEVHHRIKNNITSIAGLLMLQMENSSETETVKALQDTYGRVKSMAMIYEMLTGSDEVKKLSIADYIHGLASSVVSLFPNKEQVKLNLQLMDFDIDSELLFSLGIIINEILTNTLKYAISDDSDTVVGISVTTDGKRCVLRVSDNGPGFPESVDVKASTQLGLVLVRMLVNQIDGELKIENKQGVRFIISFENQL